MVIAGFGRYAIRGNLGRIELSYMVFWHTIRQNDGGGHVWIGYEYLCFEQCCHYRQFADLHAWVNLHDSFSNQQQ